MPNIEHLLCGVVYWYIPPCGSEYAHPDPYLELQTEYDRYCSDIKKFLLFEDFNSRTAYVILLYQTISFVSLMELRSCILKMQTFCNVLKHVIYHLNAIILIGKQMHMVIT